MFLRKFGAAMRTRAGSAAAMLAMLTRLAARLPTQTRRSEESEHFQQFSTPIALGFVAAEAAALDTGRSRARTLRRDRLAGDLRRTRQGTAGAERDRRYPRRSARPPVPRHRGQPPQRRADPRPARSGDPAERRADEPAFLGLASCRGPLRRSRDPAHSSALARLADGGRLVAITGHNLAPDKPAWREGFVRLQEKGRVVFSAAIDGQAYVRHGTNIETRLTVIDRVPAEDPRASFRPRRASRPMPPNCSTGCRVWCRRARRSQRPRHLPPRRHVSAPRAASRAAEAAAAPARQAPGAAAGSRRARLRDPRLDAGRAARLTAASMKATRCKRSTFRARSRIRPGWCSRRRWPRSPLPAPRYRPHLPPACSRPGCCPTPSSKASSMPARPMRVISPVRGLSTRPSMSSRPRPTMPRTPCVSGAAGFSATAPAPARAARSPASSSTTGSRAAAARVWVSKSDKLIEDAQRDWSAIGGYRSDIMPLSRFRQGAPIRLDEGILFTTYATLRTQAQGRQAEPRPADHRLARTRLRRRHRLRRGPRHGQRRRRQVRARRKETVAAGPRRAAPAARAARRARALRLGDRRHDRAEPRLCRAPRPLGRR